MLKLSHLLSVLESQHDRQLVIYFVCLRLVTQQEICFRRAIAYLDNVQERLTTQAMKSPLTLVPPQYRVIITTRGFRRAKPPTVCLPACPTLACDSILPVTLNSSSRCVICNTRSNRTKTASGNVRERKSFASYPQTRHQYWHQPSILNHASHQSLVLISRSCRASRAR